MIYLPAGLTGPVRAKILSLSDGSWLAGTSVEAGYRWDSPPDAPYRVWSVWVERSTDQGRSWSRHGPVTVPDQQFGVIQPTLWETPDHIVRMYMRSTERLGRIMASSSTDGGRTWTPALRTGLPNPNAGIDLVRLSDDRLILVYNHLQRGRNAIHLAVSDDQGDTWGSPQLLEAGEGELSYPAVIQTHDGNIHITYTWNRTHVRHLVLDPDRIRK